MAARAAALSSFRTYIQNPSYSSRNNSQTSFVWQTVEENSKISENAFLGKGVF